MDTTSLTQHFTLLLAGPAKNVAPVLTQRISLDRITKILDSGMKRKFTPSPCWKKRTSLRGVVLARPEVLTIAAEMATAYGVIDRLKFVGGDMFIDHLLQNCEVIL